MVGYKLFIEGGGDSASLRTACRSGFTDFLKKAGLAGKMPKIIPSGSRQKTYADFCTAIENNQKAFLLVDSEELVNTSHQGKPWQHLGQWKQPIDSTDEQCHLMVVCMESWFLADRKKLEVFFGQDFQASALPDSTTLESVTKKEVYDALAKATA